MTNSQKYSIYQAIQQASDSELSDNFMTAYELDDASVETKRLGALITKEESELANAFGLTTEELESLTDEYWFNVKGELHYTTLEEYCNI